MPVGLKAPGPVLTSLTFTSVLPLTLPPTARRSDVDPGGPRKVSTASVELPTPVKLPVVISVSLGLPSCIVIRPGPGPRRVAVHEAGQTVENDRLRNIAAARCDDGATIKEHVVAGPEDRGRARRPRRVREPGCRGVVIERVAARGEMNKAGDDTVVVDRDRPVRGLDREVVCSRDVAGGRD